MFKRILAKKLKESAKSFPVVLLTGPRQSGKTTLVKQLFPDFEYVLLEAPDTLLEVKNDPRGYLSRRVKGWIFDEAQCFPDLFSYLQEYIDQEKRQPVILTGSQNFLLSERITQSLAGRVAILELLPLSYPEITSVSKWRNISLFNLLFQGSYPRPYQESIATADWYQNYIQTYLERDVRQITQVGDLSQFQLFLKLCAGRVGQILNIESLGADCGISQTTATRWLSILEASRIIFRLPPHYKNFRKRLIKRPKLYFFDTSIVCGLLGIDSTNELETHAHRGAIFENWVLSEVSKFFFNHGKRPPIFFWRDHRGLEIDLIVDRSNSPYAIEIKSSSTLAKDFTDSLLAWKNISGVAEDHFALVYGGKTRKTLDKVEIYPWVDIERLCQRLL